MKRLIEEGGTKLEVDLLRVAREEDPPDGAALRTLAALGLGSAALSSSTALASAGAGAAAAGTRAGLMAIAMKWVGVGAVGGAVTLGAVQGAKQLGSSWSEPRPVAVAQSGQEGSAGQEKPISRPSEPLPSPASEQEPPAGRVPPGAAPQPLDRPFAGSAPADPGEPAAVANAEPEALRAAGTPPSRSLAPEIALVDEARRAVAANRPNDALGLLARHAEQFPQGQLVPEATYLRIQALMERGDRQAAAELGRRYLGWMPDGPHAKQVRAILAAAGQRIP